MKLISVTLLSVLCLAFSTVATASTYVLQGSSTDLWDQDVDYFSPPITLERTKDTFSIYQLNFNILSHQKVCLSYQQICTARNSQGACISWQNQCTNWEDQTTPVPRTIELDFSRLPALTGDQTEEYQLTIQREQPVEAGVDSVSTWLDEVKTLVPVKIIQWSDFHYEIDPQN